MLGIGALGFTGFGFVLKGGLKSASSIIALRFSNLASPEKFRFLTSIPTADCDAESAFALFTALRRYCEAVPFLPLRKGKCAEAKECLFVGDFLLFSINVDTNFETFLDVLLL